MLVIDCLPVFEFRVLVCFYVRSSSLRHKLNMLLNKAFDLKDWYLASGVSAHDENILVFINSFHIHACNWVTLNRAVTQSFNFKFSTVEHTHSSIISTNSNVFF